MGDQRVEVGPEFGEKLGEFAVAFGFGRLRCAGVGDLAVVVAQAVQSRLAAEPDDRELDGPAGQGVDRLVWG
ncbi:hypothetical protein [Streptomyces sp. NPDC093225]|uniref:hypothetical protein n=1 Tax=Streptomyces sp. NPDC093225 TaxID=3366034 RepID=UPI00380936EE